MVRITNPQRIPLSYCKSICWHLGSWDSCELCQLAGVHVSCNHHLDVLAESNWIQLSTHCPPRLHAFLHLHPLLRDLAGPPKRGRAYFPAPMMLGLVVWHALSNRISDVGTSFTAALGQQDLRPSASVTTRGPISDSPGGWDTCAPEPAQTWEQPPDKFQPIRRCEHEKETLVVTSLESGVLYYAAPLKMTADWCTFPVSLTAAVTVPSRTCSYPTWSS